MSVDGIIERTYQIFHYFIVPYVCLMNHGYASSITNHGFVIIVTNHGQIKLAKEVPIHKQEGSKTEVGKYRPI